MNMKMNVRSTQPRSARHAQTAVAVAEFIIAVGIGSMVAAAVMALSLFSGRSYAALGNYVDLDIKSRNALDSMIREIRQAKAVTYYQTNMLKLTNFSNQLLTYAWDPGTGELRRSVNGVQDSRPLLTQCDQLRFDIYQRNPQAGVYGFFPTTNDVTICKLVEMSWICSRSIFNKRVNSESVQTAKVVIRNQKVQN
jgi:Tfp pilus assembly protein PilW